MLHIREFHDLDGLTDRLRDAGEVNAALMAEVTALHAGENSPARLLIS
jgi:hypothetical protein